MKRKVITAEVVENSVANNEYKISHAADTIVTPAARDAAKKYGVAFCPEGKNTIGYNEIQKITDIVLQKLGNGKFSRAKIEMRVKEILSGKNWK